MSDVLNPAEVERSIQEISRRMHEGIKVISRLNDEYKAARRAHDKAKAMAYVAHDGPQLEKRQVAELAVVELREAMDDAKVKLDYARDLADTLSKELSALQSINRSVTQMYGAERGYGG